MIHLLFFPLLAILAIASPLESRAPKYNVTAMNIALNRGSGILGSYSKCSGSLCSWMSKISDDTKLIDISIPGTHDTASWNYTPLKQIEYLKYTNLIYPSSIYKCNKESIFKQLQSGNRAFDLRIGLSPKNSNDLIFFHSEAILDLNSKFEDILFGFWRFLDENPTETLIISIKDENSTFGSYNILQQNIYNTLTTNQAKIYINPTESISSINLSSVRGKMVILRRFNSPNNIGIDLTNNFKDNNEDFQIINSSPDGDDNIFIEDLYEPFTNFGLKSHVNKKLNVTISHILNSSNKKNGEGLYITYASSEVISQLLIPEIMSNGLIIPGVNLGLKNWLINGKGKGLKQKGIICK
uniref:Phosphatidylinositol-specific phospholipase C X domain-containing protein n=1 Tax=Kwoniella pini CBS 10737 TaxID=1296096 RepID=A0A1B9HYP9_9TREE|nr:uncharacterized protein I206_05161 [Kwoniella pini CBS 10737]OCF48384.1 hypothetical protein I206_05161 [Kwoniella pini CBS 10737]